MGTPVTHKPVLRDPYISIRNKLRTFDKKLKAFSLW